MTDATVARLAATPIVYVLSELGAALPSERVSAWPRVTPASRPSRRVGATPTLPKERP